MRSLQTLTGRMGAGTRREEIVARARSLSISPPMAGYCSGGSSRRPPGDASLSFFGIVFEDPRIARVLITTGNAAPGPNDNDRRDIVMMDDFIYGEPQPRGRRHGRSSSDETASSAAATDGKTAAADGRKHHRRRARKPCSDGHQWQREWDCSGHCSHSDCQYPPAGQQFAGWTGDITILASPT